jgi:hypothetical protein
VVTMPAGAAGPKKLKQPKTFPITISAPGSYILASNLTVPDENTTAISVQADYVTIDLNGFSIQGPVTCTGSPVTSCSPSFGTGRGIDGLGHRGLTVRNGSVHGMGFRGIDVGGGRVENVTAEGNGESGIYGGTVTGSMANGNYEIGIGGVTVSNSSAYGNRLLGIEADGAVSNSTANVNGEGIYASGGSVTNCTANSNTSYGIAASSGSVTNCTAQANGADGISAKTATGCTAQFNSGAQISGAAGIAGHNICGDPGSPCP